MFCAKLFRILSFRPMPIGLHKSFCKFNTNSQYCSGSTSRHTQLELLVSNSSKINSHFRNSRQSHNNLNNHAKTKANTGTVNKQKRIHILMLFVYGSGAIGAVLLTAVVLRFYNKFKVRLKGFQELSIPEYGRNTTIYRYKGTVLFDVVAKTVQEVEKFNVRHDDIWVVSFPRSGTTWLQEIIYLIENGLDYEKAKLKTLDERFPYLEFEYPGIKEVEKMPSPRYIKSHLPYHLLPTSLREKNPKIVYIARNPRDVIVSYYHFARMLLPLRFTGTFQQFSDLFLKNLVPYAPWSDHILQFWQCKDDDNVLFITYEQLQKDTKETIERLATFLGKSLTNAQISELIAHCSFDRMKMNESVNHRWFDTLGLRREGEADFMRTGKIGEWQNEFTESLNVRVEQMIQHRLKDTGLYFDFYPSDG